MVCCWYSYMLPCLTTPRMCRNLPDLDRKPEDMFPGKGWDCNIYVAIILVVYCYNQLQRIEAIAIIFQLYIKHSVQKCLQHAFWWFAYNLIPHCIGFCRYFAESKETNQPSYLFLLLENKRKLPSVTIRLCRFTNMMDLAKYTKALCLQQEQKT